VTYKNILQGEFLSRPNRFIANVEIDGKTEVCHVKNTGRCRELLIPGATVFLEKSDNPERKTKYDLIAVYKGEHLINMDSQAPNKVFAEWAISGGYFGKIDYIKPEFKFKNSRIDFYIEAEGRKILIEVKGVTLENEKIASFPDAPTERGIKHIKELSEAVGEGFEAYVFFIIQMDYCTLFTPNRETHPEFADALAFAKEKGVNIKAMGCKVSPESIKADSFVKVQI